MAIERLSDDAIQRVCGPAWEPLKQTFLDMSEVLLSAAPESVGVLTTIYVKYQIGSAPNSAVFAVVWLKNSKQILLGLALPEDFESPLLGPAPTGMKYKGITKYLALKPGEQVPTDLAEWAVAAFATVTNEKTT
jgi:hypothetical protein